MNQQINSQQNICKAHSGLEARLKTMEENVSRLWIKWDKMQTIVIGIFLTMSLNLITAIVILFFK